MVHQTSGPTPDAGNVLKFVATIAWRSKWLIGGATIVAAAVAFALAHANTVQTWSGRTTLTIGLAPTVDYILQPISPPVAVVETPRNAAARISNPVFKGRVVS